MRMKHLFITLLLLLLAASVAGAQVLGPCSTGSAKAATQGPKKMAPAAPKAPAAPAALLVQPIPLPGQKAIDFELPAVVGNEIKNIKLSDSAGKWRVLCFFPAAFTFV